MDIDSILDSLTQEDMEKLKATAAQFLGGTPDAGDERKKGEADKDLFSGITPDMLSAVGRLRRAFDKNDPRSDFIRALKPLLSPGRSKKAEEALTMLKFMNILNALKEEGL